MNSKKFPFHPYRILKYIFGLVLLPFFFVNKADTPDAVVCSWAVILSALCLCLYRDFKQKKFSVNKKLLRISIPVTVLFVVMLSFDGIIKCPFFTFQYWTEHSGFFQFSILFWAYALYLPSVFFGAWLLIHSCFEWFEIPKQVAEADGTNDKKLFWLCAGAIAALSVISVLSAYPGVWIEGDVATVLAYIESEWSNWHPFPYLLLVWAGNSIFHTTFAINVFQTIVWILLQIYILHVLKSIQTRCMIIYTIILCISATPFTYLAVMYKDTVFSMGVLGITAALVQIIRKKEVSKIDFLVLNMAALFVTLFRHAGQAVTAIMCLSCILYFRKTRKLLLRFAATLGIQIGFYLLFFVVLFQQFNVTENPAYVKYGTPIAMIGAAVQDGMVFDAEDQAQLEKVMSLEEWGNCYDKYWADSISRWWGSIGNNIFTIEDLIQKEDYGSFLIKMNAKILAKNPRLYFRAFFDMNSILWEMGMPSDYRDMSLCQVNTNESIRYTAFHRFTDLWWRFGEELSVTHALFQRAGASLFTIFVLLLVLFRKKRVGLLFACIPIIMHNVLLFITIPAQDPRYALPAIECAIFIAALIPAIATLSKKTKEETQNSPL